MLCNMLLPYPLHQYNTISHPGQVQWTRLITACMFLCVCVVCVVIPAMGGAEIGECWALLLDSGAIYLLWSGSRM